MSEPGGATPRPVTLTQLREEVKRRASRGRQDLHVLVDSQQHVLATFTDAKKANRDLQRRFDEDHTAVDALSLLELSGGFQASVLWPAEHEPFERARQLAVSLYWEDRAGVDNERLLEEVRRRSLRGRIIESSDGMRAIELWWMTAEDPRVPVGALIERARCQWTLYLADGALQPKPEVVYDKLGKLLGFYLRDEDWSPVLVEAIARAIRRRDAPGQTFDSLLAEFGIRLTMELGLLPKGFEPHA